MKNLIQNPINEILEAYHYSAKSLVRFFHLATDELEKKEWENLMVKIVLFASGIFLVFPGLIDGFEKYQSLSFFILSANISFLLIGKLVSPKAPMN